MGYFLGVLLALEVELVSLDFGLVVPGFLLEQDRGLERIQPQPFQDCFLQLVLSSLQGGGFVPFLLL